MESRNTKQRLEELYDLLQAKYITESEFRIARINILRESGFDLSHHASHSRDEEDSEEEFFDEPDSRKKGCGCFLFVVLLVVGIASGAAFFASEWPDGLGGRYVRAAREEISTLWGILFLSSEEESASLPVLPIPKMPVSDDVASQDATGDATPVSLSLPGNDGAPGRQPAIPGTPAPVSLERSALPPSLEIVSSGLSGEAVSTAGPEEPEVTIVEIPSTLSVPSADSAIGTSEGRALQWGVVSGNSVRVRSAPDTSDTSNVVGWGRKGDRFSILEQGTDKFGSVWYRIRLENSNREGWISGALVRVER
ncbi:MAG: SH3 domain-containing protein [Synergistaceae bacterium]|jgi:hypothetical protein|nr:SH3 domain-containing protein [Synergistaceae bacterium]